ncbi:unnamed protein product [Acanthoscelides obtectus]|uniref:Uncharacterized protein n=1 Tax=Acanthoscelides obtectus TaxID=200917 RepID=A0A9P0NZK1_ACAOB|nr:unnamed protein product [Acanthoscelides obtectus]CAH2012292.1 unnamed protein product [Acanthoscelides obtectus]CAK1631581.1 hypothetical protein AOBTE_LOCUS7017 [Acanthoscelides obtectus]CAK1683056.1 hypothetical protein AOBTE_LOCUS34052 [Acanthoscelides obtectus]
MEVVSEVDSALEEVQDLEGSAAFIMITTMTIITIIIID